MRFVHLTATCFQSSGESIATSIAWQPMSGLVASLDHGNGLDLAITYTDDYRIDDLTVADGMTDIIDRAHAFGDGINLTGITDAVTSTNSETLSYTDDNMLETADGAWGDLTFAYDAVGNRTSRELDDGSVTTETLSYPGASNLIEEVSVGMTPWFPVAAAPLRASWYPRLHP